MKRRGKVGFAGKQSTGPPMSGGTVLVGGGADITMDQWVNCSVKMTLLAACSCFKSVLVFALLSNKANKMTNSPIVWKSVMDITSPSLGNTRYEGLDTARLIPRKGQFDFSTDSRCLLKDEAILFFCLVIFCISYKDLFINPEPKQKQI